MKTLAVHRSPFAVGPLRPSANGHRPTKILALIIALISTTLCAQTPIDLEAGFRFLNLRGSSDMYRTQINERSGFLIRSLTWAGSDTRFTDFFRVDASDLGVGPAGSLRV